jgi:hypothetical protein
MRSFSAFIALQHSKTLYLVSDFDDIPIEQTNNDCKGDEHEYPESI